MIGVAIVLVFITIFLYYYNVSWWYECILGRLPIFIYGVIFKEQAKSYKITCIIGLLFFLPCFRSISPFLAVSGLTIPLIIFSLKLINITPNKLYGLISYVGVHSLEFYLANLFVYWTYESGCYTLKERLVIFISIQTIATAFLIITNKILYIAK